MYKVFSFTNTDEAAPYMDKKILRYIDEQITDSFECFKDCDILAFDWYDVQSEKKRILRCSYIWTERICWYFVKPLRQKKKQI